MRTSIFGIVFVTLGILAFGFDFMTAKKAAGYSSARMEKEDNPYPLQWSSLLGALLCAGGFALITRVAGQEAKDPGEHQEVLNLDRRVNNLKNKIKKPYDTKINKWTSFKHELNHIWRSVVIHH